MEPTSQPQGPADEPATNQPGVAPGEPNVAEQSFNEDNFAQPGASVPPVNPTVPTTGVSEMPTPTMSDQKFGVTTPLSTEQDVVTSTTPVETAVPVGAVASSPKKTSSWLWIALAVVVVAAVGVGIYVYTLG